MKLFASLLLSAAALPLAANAQAASPAAAPDAIYFHGHILTGEGLDTKSPRFVTALAVKDGKILATGDDATILKLAGAQTTRTDLGGAFTMPGINDAHVHLGEAGRTKLTVDLTGTPSRADMLKRIHNYAVGLTAGQWITGGGWDHTLWADQTLPTKADLDAVTEGHPAMLSRIDGHISIVNSAAFTTAGITNSTPDPQGGKFDHDAKGELTGIVREGPAESLLGKHIPPPTPDLRLRGLQLALADAAAHGITSTQDNSGWEDFKVMEKLEHDDQLPVRVSEWLAFDAPLDTLKSERASHSASDPMLHTAMLKGFMDGSLGSHTAAMKAPYSDEPGNSGLPRYTQDQLNKLAIERSEAGFQMGFHAIGDRAVAMALDAFGVAIAEKKKLLATAQAQMGKNVQANIAVTFEPRYRIEHAQVVDPADIPRFKQLGVIASMQPNHLLTDMNWADKRLGPSRTRSSYTWKQFLDAGVHVAFGTDYPVEPITPFRGIYCAVTRMSETGTKSYHPEDKITIYQALYAYTQGSAYAEFSEKWKGKLIPGYVADFVVLDRDLTTIAPPEILKTTVLHTYVGGKQVYVGGIHITSAKQLPAL